MTVMAVANGSIGQGCSREAGRCTIHAWPRSFRAGQQVRAVVAYNTELVNW